MNGSEGDNPLAVIAVVLVILVATALVLWNTILILRSYRDRWSPEGVETLSDWMQRSRPLQIRHAIIIIALLVVLEVLAAVMD